MGRRSVAALGSVLGLGRRSAETPLRGGFRPARHLGGLLAALLIGLGHFKAPIGLAQNPTVDDFNPGANGTVISLAVQADGKIVVGGAFTTLGGQPRQNIGRLNPNGALDTGFNPGASSSVLSLAVQEDGKIVVGGAFTTLGGQPRNYLGRLYPDGTADASFDPSANSYVRSLAVQADGKILVGGEFTTLGGQGRSYLGRLNPDGTVDPSFSLGAGGNYPVYSLAVQADGKILVGGQFTTLGGQPRERIARLNPSGTLDIGFNPGADSYVLSLAVQADGKILVGGEFGTLGGQRRERIARLNSDGTVDSEFNSWPSNPVYSLAVQADRKILVGGAFTTLGGQTREWIARLNPVGSLDSSFNPGASHSVHAVAVQADGKILVGGAFTTLGGQPRNRVGRLNNTGPATQNMSYDGSTITWLRGGTGPEVWRTTFEVSTNGTDWRSLGAGQRIAGGWHLRNVTVPTGSSIRARGFATSGESAWFVESHLGPPVIASPSMASGQQGVPFSYGIVATNSPSGFLAEGLPDGLGLDSTSGVISGTPTLAGWFDVLISATNALGVDTRTLQLTLSPCEPRLTSALVVNGTELAALNYTLTAFPPATGYGAAGLPPGLTLDRTTGVISGAPVYGGTNHTRILASNAYGTSTNVLEFRVAYAALPGLVITNVAYLYSRPYLLDFTFSLRDGANPNTAHAVVRPPSHLSVTCRESGVAINPLETAFIVEKGDQRQFKAYLVLDYSRSMTALANGDANGNGISDAIENMEAAAKELLRQLPPAAQVGLYEFHADWEDPIRLHGPTSDRAVLDAAIDGIWTAMQLPDASAGSRCWDGLLAAVNDFGAPDPDENRYVVFISDGYDTSSIVVPADVIGAAQAKRVRLYCVAYGTLIDATTLGQLTAQTGGRYFRAENAASLASAFALLGKDLDGQYLLRWATLRRNATPFRPSFDITVAGRTHQFTAPVDYAATSYGTNREVFSGALRLVADAEEGADAVILRTTYAPRNIRKLRLQYRPNYDCQPILLSTGAGEVLDGWTMNESQDDAGGRWLELNSPNPNDNTKDIPYGALGNLVQFQFTGLPSPAEAFSLFQVDNTVYAGLPGPPAFNLAGVEAFIAMNTPPLIGALDGFMGFANGQFGFRIGGLPGQVVILETSGNLRDWTALETNVLGNVAIEFSDPGSGSLPSRFYRARLP